jgi:hypothetical protein
MVDKSIILLFVTLNTGVSLYGQSKELFRESFDDDKLLQRGWYDGTSARLSENSFNGHGAIEYEWTKGDQQAQGSSPQRHLFDPVEEVYIRFYLRLSEKWEWTKVNWHPHLIHFLTTSNGAFDGPAATHLTLYIEPVNGKLRLAAQDIQNEKMPHGLTQGPLKGGYNGMLYDSREIIFKDDKWHCIEAYFKLNSLNTKDSVPNNDGIIMGWFDGKKVIDRTDVILRSTDFPDMKFNQLLMAPYFGPGLLNNSQKLWIDELVVSTGRDIPGTKTSHLTNNAGIFLFTDSSWISDDREKRFTYGLNINSPWEHGGTIFMHFPEHLEYNTAGNTILRHYDSIPAPWIISPDRFQASYRVESPAVKNVFVESFVRKLHESELPPDVSGVKLAMHILNKGNEILPVIRALLCIQYAGLTGFPQKMQHNFEHNFILIDGRLTPLSGLETSNHDASFKGCVVKDCPQNDTRAEAAGGLITEKMDLALSVVSSMDNSRKIIIWWTPGKSMIANARIPCMHADPYYGTLKPGEDTYAEGLLLFIDGDAEPVVRFLLEKGSKIF